MNLMLLQAKRFSHGVRLAKKYEMDSELTNMALKSTPNVMIDAADYLNEKVMRAEVTGLEELSLSCIQDTSLSCREWISSNFLDCRVCAINHIQTQYQL
jgi:hypothetical protein